MNVFKTLAVAVVMAASAVAHAAAPDPAQVKAVQEMLASMQAEKLMRATAGASRFANDQQRQAVFAKLEKVAPAEIYQKLAAPVAKFVSTATAQEMSKFYASSYGKRVLQQTYNSGPSMYGAQEPVPTKTEKAELKRPELVAARKALAEADQAIRHEAFVLLGEISKR